MIRLFTLHPTAANLMMILFMVAGILTLPQIKRETFPKVHSWEVQVKVVYPGATPTDVEQAICKPLEDALESINYTEEKRCESRQSLGLMTIKMREEGDFQQFMDDVNTAVDGIDSFPDNAEKPIVSEVGRTDDVVTLALTAPVSRPELKDLAEHIKEKMLADPGIPQVVISGFSTRQFQIQVPQENLRQYGLSLQEIANRIARQDLDLPLGNIKTDERQYQIRFSDERRTIDELANLVILHSGSQNELKLGDIAQIKDSFELDEDKVTYNGQPAAFLKIRKNTLDDSLKVLDAVKAFIAREQPLLPAGVEFNLTQDFTSIVKDRIKLLMTNGWQGLLSVFIVMWLFFGTRYAFWVVMGLPVSFLASAFVLGHLGVTINMLSLVALLLALGLLMDDAIVISESIGHQIRHGKTPLSAAIDGTRVVAKGVFSSFLTTLCVFIGLVFIKGEIGQVIKVIPVVLISVLVVSLIEAFFILPHHLKHSLEHAHKKAPTPFRVRFDQGFEATRRKLDALVSKLIQVRYLFVGSVIALFFVSISMMASGILKFSAFPDVEGDVVQARILMPAGTSVQQTEKTVNQLVTALKQVNKEMKEPDTQLVQAITVLYNTNQDANESGAHLATISVDLLTAEQRHHAMREIIHRWQTLAGDLPQALNVSIKEPAIGPSGKAIEIRLQGDDLMRLSAASHELQNWLRGYPGVSNLLDDLRPGIPEFTLHLKEGAYALGLDASTIANQLRTAYQGSTVKETHMGNQSWDVNVILAESSRDDLADFDQFPIIHPQTGKSIPLETVADIINTRSFSRINRVDNLRTVSVQGDIDKKLNNTNAIMADIQKTILPKLAEKYPDVKISLQGEVKNGAVTQGSMKQAFILGLMGIFILLSFQFRSYVEPIIVMVNIPLAIIGVIWGHMLLGIDITMPSLMGAVSLAGIVVNDSILLVEFVKQHVAGGMSVHRAAAVASHDRFRAVLLTSLTTMAGMTPLLFETSLQAQVLIPLATSIIFGIATSTLLVLFVVPCLYCILEDIGLAKAKQDDDLTADEAGQAA